MVRYLRGCLLLACLFGLVLTRAAPTSAAPVPAIDWWGGQAVEFDCLCDVTAGWEFFVDRRLWLVALGNYAESTRDTGNEVGLFQSDTKSLLSRATVRPNGSLSARWYYTELAAPVLLVPGQGYTLGAQVDRFFVGLGDFSYRANDRLRTAGPKLSVGPLGSGLLFPESPLDRTPVGNIGPNFLFEVALLGDANGDCSVGAADYALWAAQFGQTGAGLPADFDDNGSVGAGDYALWAANFGNTCPPGGAASGAAGNGVPEPAAWQLGLGGIVAWLIARRRTKNTPG